MPHPGFEHCPGSGHPPYRYIKGHEKPKKSSTGRVIYARAICEVCGKEKSVNVNGRLRNHLKHRTLKAG